MLSAQYAHYTLDFKFDARTSRGSLLHKDTWFVRIADTANPNAFGIGECAMFKGLSADDRPDFEDCLRWVCRNINSVLAEGLPPMSSIRMGVECALQQLFTPISNAWTRGDDHIVINGLIWMGDRPTMLRRVEEKLAQGFKCLKLKIGGIDLEQEIDILRHIRSKFSADELTLRLDANGHFTPDNALPILERLAEFDIHSIEQPIAAGQQRAMAEICRHSAIPIALDEELIGCRTTDEMQRLLDSIMPQYVILKPSLCGGLSASEQWRLFAKEREIGSWVTSALESNIGLRAIAANTYPTAGTAPQGLGTGQLFFNNIPTGLELVGERLRLDPSFTPDYSMLQWK